MIETVAVRPLFSVGSIADFDSVCFGFAAEKSAAKPKQTLKMKWRHSKREAS